MSRDIISAIAHQLENDRKELKAAEEITESVFPVISNLRRSDILNPVSLKAKTAKISKKYRDAFFGLCQIATNGGPEGSIVVLDEEKVKAIVEDLEGYEVKDKKSKKRTIFGISKRILKILAELTESTLSALCHLVNDLVLKKIIHIPSPDKLKGNLTQITSLVIPKKKKAKSR